MSSWPPLAGITPLVVFTVTTAFVPSGPFNFNEGALTSVLRNSGLDVAVSFTGAAGSTGDAFLACMSARAGSGPEAEGPLALANDGRRVTRWISSRSAKFTLVSDNALLFG